MKRLKTTDCWTLTLFETLFNVVPLFRLYSTEHCTGASGIERVDVCAKYLKHLSDNFILTVFFRIWRMQAILGSCRNVFARKTPAVITELPSRGKAIDSRMFRDMKRRKVSF